MKLVMEVDYLVCDPKSGIYRYRRRVPERLRPLVGKLEIIKSLRTKDRSLALDRYPAAHKEAEDELRRVDVKSTEQINYEATLSDLKQAKLISDDATRVPKVDADDQTRAMAFRDAILAVADGMTDTRLQARPFTKNDKFDRMVQAMAMGVEPPKVRLSKAVEVYLSEKKTNFNARDLAKQVNLVQAKLVEVMGEADPALISITRRDAQRFRDRLIEEGSALTTVKRRISTIKAVLNLAGEELDGLEGFENPFNKLGVAGLDDVIDRELRDALNLTEIKACAPYIAAKNSEVRDIWVLMLFTGARPKEISGLTWDDIFLDHPTPHIFIRPNRLRRLKTKRSKRKVPLVGEALAVMTDRRSNKGGEDDVFPKYAGEAGSSNLSVLQVKAMQQAGVWVDTKKVYRPSENLLMLQGRR